MIDLDDDRDNMLQVEIALEMVKNAFAARILKYKNNPDILLTIAEEMANIGSVLVDQSNALKEAANGNSRNGFI